MVFAFPVFYFSFNFLQLDLVKTTPITSINVGVERKM
jgi:hypothetical protein